MTDISNITGLGNTGSAGGASNSSALNAAVATGAVSLVQSLLSTASPPSSAQSQYNTLSNLFNILNVFAQAPSAAAQVPGRTASYISELYQSLLTTANLQQAWQSPAISNYYSSAFGASPTGGASTLATTMQQMVVYGLIADGTIKMPTLSASDTAMLQEGTPEVYLNVVANLNGQLAAQIQNLGVQNSPDPVLAGLYANAFGIANTVSQSLMDPNKSLASGNTTTWGVLPLQGADAVQPAMNILNNLQLNFDEEYFNSDTKIGAVQSLNQAMLKIQMDAQIADSEASQTGVSNPITSPVSYDTMATLVGSYSALMTQANSIAAMAQLNQNFQSRCINVFNELPVGGTEGVLDPAPIPATGFWSGPNAATLMNVYAMLGGTGNHYTSLQVNQAGNNFSVALSSNSLQAQRFRDGISSVLQTLSGIPLNTSVTQEAQLNSDGSVVGTPATPHMVNVKYPAPPVPGSNPPVPMTTLGQALATGNADTIERAFANAFTAVYAVSPTQSKSYTPQNAVDQWNSAISQMENLQGQLSQSNAQASANIQATVNQISSLLTQMTQTLSSLFQAIMRMAQ